jgi:uncharacterized protein YegL
MITDTVKVQEEENKEVKTSMKPIKIRREGGTGGGGGLRAEMEMLRDQLDVTDANRTPQLNESLREFYRYVSQSVSLPKRSIIKDNIINLTFYRRVGVPQFIGRDKRWINGDQREILK